MDVLCWLILGAALVIGTFGVSVFLTLVVSGCIILIGGLLSLRWMFLEESDHWWLALQCSHLALSLPCLAKISHTMASFCPGSDKGTAKVDTRITGSNLIDDQLQAVIKYFLRDFVSPWFDQISRDPRFVSRLELALQHSLVSISSRCKSTDWVGYLTTRLVDDVASHLRLFREARAAAKSKSRGGAAPSAPPSSGEPGAGGLSPPRDLIDFFFEKETQREGGDLCRDAICLKPDAEKDYLSDLVEVVLYLTVPADEFANTPARSAVIEIVVSSLVMPLVNMLSEPDYINSIIVWACTDIPISSELFLAVIKSTTDPDELNAVRGVVSKEINQLRSRDSGGREEGSEVKQQIASLDYLRQVIDARVNRIGNGTETDSMGLPINFDYSSIPRGKLFQLPLEVILKNSLTLDHFLNYMSSIECQHYVNLYLNIECWKTSVSERLCAVELEKIHREHRTIEGERGDRGSGDRGGGGEGFLAPSSTMPDLCHDYFSAHDLAAQKSEADVMYEQYLSEKAHPRVKLDDSVVKMLILRLRSERLTETWFDETQEALFSALRDTDMFLPAFRRSVWYIRLLAEFDLLKDVSRSDEEDSQSLEEDGASGGSGWSGSGVGGEGGQGDDLQTDSNLQNDSSPRSSLHPSPNHTRAPSLTPKPYTITAHIAGTEIVREGNRSHAIYRVNVIRRDYSGLEDMWHVFRRYSEFYDFHVTISSRFLDLSSIPFPSKKMLNNLAAWFLEKRMNELTEWLDRMLVPSTLQSHPGMQDMVARFLDLTPYHSNATGAPGQGHNLAKRVEDSLVTPLRVGVKSVSCAVKSVPDSVINTVDGIYKKLGRHGGCAPPPPQGKGAPNTPGVGGEFQSQKASIDLEGGDENIPLRILLLLMDEVFDLRSKDQWFRRRVVLFLRQILKAMCGDIVNRRILEGVEGATAPEQVAGYVRIVKESIWPHGVLAPSEDLRDNHLALRTKVAARTCMLASISDEFKAILGTQTTHRGVYSVYECVQWKALNKRLVYVLLGGILEAVFSGHRQVPAVLRTLTTSSSRLSARNAPAGTRRTSKL